MPFYIVDDIKKRNPDENPNISMQAAAGEFMKAAIVTKPEGEGVPLHMHPNEEQWTYLIEGKMHYVLGDEERILEPGDFVHIPRNVNHRSRAIDGSAKFLQSRAQPVMATCSRIIIWLAAKHRRKPKRVTTKKQNPNNSNEHN